MKARPRIPTSLFCSDFRHAEIFSARPSASEALWYDWRETFRDDARVARVTAADVQRVARTYFTKNNRTVATLVRPAEADSSLGAH